MTAGARPTSRGIGNGDVTAGGIAGIVDIKGGIGRRVCDMDVAPDGLHGATRADVDDIAGAGAGDVEIESGSRHVDRIAVLAAVEMRAKGSGVQHIKRIGLGSTVDIKHIHLVEVNRAAIGARDAGGGQGVGLVNKVESIVDVQRVGTGAAVD